MQTAHTALPPEQTHFSQQADSWWDPHGPMRMLHQIMPLRCDLLLDQLGTAKAQPLPLKGMRFLDVGCGGGLVTEALTRMGAEVTGLDISESLLAVARAHAAENHLDIIYKQGTAESLAQKDVAAYDGIVAFEVLEHITDKPSFIKALSRLLKPDAWLFLSTLNRTRRGFLLGVVMAEYVLRWVPMGTHEWELFITPSDLKALLEDEGLSPTDLTGMVYNPLTRQFALKKGRVGVNYFMTARKNCK